MSDAPPARARPSLGRLLCRAVLALAVLAPPGAPAAAASCPPTLQPPTSQQVEQMRRQARDRGMLWRITRDGRSSYLFGTIHLGKPAWIVPGPRLSAVLREMDVLALELDFGDPQVQAEAAAYGAMGHPIELPAPLALRLQRQRETACLPLETLARMHPLMQAMTISLADAAHVGLHLGLAQEILLGTLARSAGKPVISLESLALQRDLLIPTDPVEAATLVDHAVRQLESGHGRRTMARLARVWEHGRVKELEDYERWCQCIQPGAKGAADRAMLRRLLDERHPAMVERIDALHAGGQSVLAAVGALHMIGPQGLPAQMARRGYLVERIAFNPM